MPRYSPFDKPLQELSGADLAALKNAEEGWYLEYKRELPNANSVSKSVAAFANTHGGWLFYGIEEKSKTEPVAGAFPGIARADVDATFQRIRQAVSAHIVPEPHFDTRALWGPCDEIGLPSDHAVLCVYVPWGPNAPYVHKTGQIYRRVADSSEPRPENDRFVLDQLWRRSDDLNKEYDQWVEREPEFSKGEAERPHLRLLLVADLWDDRKVSLGADVTELRTIFSGKDSVLTSIPFNNVYTSSKGFIARQIGSHDPHNLGITWNLSRDLISEIIIPLNFFYRDSASMIEIDLDGYDGAARFTLMLKRYGYKSPRVVDLNLLYHILICIAEVQAKLLARAGWKGTYHAKACLLNVWRTIPFLDVPLVLDGFEKHGIPMLLDGTAMAPRGTRPETFAEVSELLHLADPAAKLFVQALEMFAPIAVAYGIPPWVPTAESDDRALYFEQLNSACRRAIEAQKHRGQDEDD